MGFGLHGAVILLGLGAAWVCMVAGPGAAEGAQTTGRLSRAMWMWSSKGVRELAADQSAWPGFFEFCAAPHGEAAARIDTLYLEVPADCDQVKLREFIGAAHDRGMKVEFLFGDGEWQAGHLERARARCDECIDSLNAGRPLRERFDGIHLDIEDRGKWSQRAFRELLIHLRKKIDAYNRAQAHKMTLAADLGFWWAEKGDDAKPQFVDAIGQCDTVVSMAYRDTAGAQASCAVPQAMAAARQRKGFFIGAETQWLVDQDFVTYYEEGWEYMERELAKLPALVAEHGGKLTGIAIHHYDSYVRMKRELRTSGFTDVRLDHRAAPYILAAHRAGVMSGYPNGEFMPTRVVTRDQMAVFMCRALLGAENVPDPPATPSFADVPPDHWAYTWIECAKAQKAMEAREDGLFHPDDAVNRAQMAVIIARAIARPTGEEGLAGYEPPQTPTFPDVTPENEWSWCYRDMEYIAAREIAKGYPDGLYHPEVQCTRDQMAVYVAKAFQFPLDT